MTITARHAARRMSKLHHLVGQVAGNIEGTVNAINLSAAEARAGGPRAEDVGIRGINWIGNPTADSALANLAAQSGSSQAKDAAELSNAINDLSAATLRLAAICERWTYSGKQADLQPDARCSGGKGHGVEEWVRPDCANPVATYRNSSGASLPRGDGLCDSCRMNRHRWQRRIEQQAKAR